MTMLMKAGQQLSEIHKTIQRRLSKYSIAENTKSLRADLGKFISQNFLFFNYIISNQKISQEQLNPSPQSTTNRNETLLRKFGASLSAFIASTNEMTSTRHAFLSIDQQSASCTSDIAIQPPPYFDCDPDTDEWIGFSELKIALQNKNETGIYGAFLDSHNDEQMLDFFDFSGYFKTICRIHQELSILESVSGTIGDLGAVMAMKMATEHLLGSITDSMDAIAAKKAKLMAFAEKHYLEIQMSAQKNPKTIQWAANFSVLRTTLTIEPHKLTDPINEQKTRIKSALESWTEEPEKKLEELGNQIQQYRQQLQPIGLSMSKYKPEYRQNTMHVMNLDPDFPLFKSARSNKILLPPPQSSASSSLAKVLSPTLSLIEGTLETYNNVHGYQNGVPTFILQCEGNQHKARAAWIFSCKQVINICPEEERTLVALQRRITVVLSTHNYNTEVADDSASFNKVLIPYIQVSIKKRLTEIAAERLAIEIDMEKNHKLTNDQELVSFTAIATSACESEMEKTLDLTFRQAIAKIISDHELAQFMIMNQTLKAQVATQQSEISEWTAIMNKESILNAQAVIQQSELNVRTTILNEEFMMNDSLLAQRMNKHAILKEIEKDLPIKENSPKPLGDIEMAQPIIIARPNNTVDRQKYALVYKIQEKIKEPVGIKKPEERITSDDLNKLGKSCSNMAKIDIDMYTNDKAFNESDKAFHSKLYLVISIYKDQSIDPLSLFKNGLHFGWSRHDLLELRGYVSVFVEVMLLIQNTKTELDAAIIQLINSCLAAYAIKMRNAMPWHKELTEFILSLRSVYHVSERETVLEVNDALTFKVSDEVTALRAKNAELTSERDQLIVEKQNALDVAAERSTQLTIQGKQIEEKNKQIATQSEHIATQTQQIDKLIQEFRNNNAPKPDQSGDDNNPEESSDEQPQAARPTQ